MILKILRRLLKRLGKLREDLRISLKETLDNMTSLLSYNGFVSIPAIGQFVINEKLKDRKVIYNSLKGFGVYFIDKVEENIPASALAYYNLNKNSLCKSILKYLGNKAETTPAQMFWLIERQNHGQKGVLLTNGLGNIFFIRDNKNILRVVYCYWTQGLWFVDADPVDEKLMGFSVGNRVFSRYSYL